MLPSEVPLKQTVPRRVDLAGAIDAYLRSRPRNKAGEKAKEAARVLHQKREQLCGIQRLSVTTAEDAAKEFVLQERRLRQLQQRLERRGVELRLVFQWKDAFRQKKSAEKPDLDFERVAFLFNAAAAYAYLGAQAHQRGPVAGGLKEAGMHFKHSAGCFHEAYQLVRANIWGLTPFWEPHSLSLDMSDTMLAALRDLMLAQAQSAYYEKAVAERISPGVTCKLAAQAALLFRKARDGFEKPEIASHLAGDSGLFSGSDRSWVARVRCNEELLEAKKQEAAATAAVQPPEDGVPDYGMQVARLRLAVAHADRAVKEAEHLPGSEKKELSALLARLKHQSAEANKENTTIYQDEVPPSAALPIIEAKKLVEPVGPEEPTLPADPFAGLLPQKLSATLQKHFADVDSKLYSITTLASEDALKAQQVLASLKMPEALEACESDRKLPERLVKAIRKAQETGGLGRLQQQLEECVSLEREALSTTSFASEMLNAVEQEDAVFVSDNPTLELSQLKSSNELTKCRSELNHARGDLRTAVDVTDKLRTRLEKATKEIEAIGRPVEQLEEQLPHKDGTPLENEPCVPALYALLQQLSELKADADRIVDDARQLKEAQQASAALGEKLIELKAEDVPAVLVEEMEPYARAESAYKEKQQQRELLLSEIRVHAAAFENAQRDASSYAERQEFLRVLSQGAEEATAVGKGLDEGLVFYKGIWERLTRNAEQAAQIAEERRTEKEALIAAEKRRREQPPPPAFRPSAATMPTATPVATPTQNWSQESVASAQNLGARATAYQAHPGYPGASHHAPYPGASHHAPYPGASRSPPPVAVATPVHAQTAFAHSQQHAAPPAPHLQQAPAVIMCYQCRQQFGVPPGTSVIGCPYCGAHNAVPGG